MSSINKVILIGNVCREPEIRAMPSGSEVANFTLATSERWKDKQTGERKEKSEFHRVSVFNEGLVRVIKAYVKKGSKLYVEGALQTRKWTNKEGQDQYTTEVVLQGFNSTLTMLDSAGGGVDAHNEAKGNGYQPEPLDDEIPF